MTREQIFDKVKDVLISEFGMEVTDTETSFGKDGLGLDSLDQMELIMTLEEKAGIEIPDEDSEKLHTVGDVVDYLYRRGI